MTAVELDISESRAARWRELRRLVQIRRNCLRDRQDRRERRRVRKLEGAVVADYLSGVLKPALRDKYRIGQYELKRIIEKGTSDEQRQKIANMHHCRREKKRWRRIHGGKNQRWIKIVVGGVLYQSIKKAAEGLGICEQTCRNYYSMGVPADQWRKRWELRGHAPYRKETEEFRSIRAAAEAVGVPPTTARRLYNRGVPVELWAEVVQQNIANHQRSA